MLKNSEGFSLIEVIASLAILTIIIASIAPFLIIIYQEKQTIKQQFYVYEILHNTLEEGRIYNFHPLPEAVIKNKDTNYVLTSKIHSDQSIQFCISWEGENGRYYKECGGGKRM